MGLNSPLPVRLQDECKKASKIIRSFVDQSNNGLDKVIPRQVLERAHGFAVFTVIKAGFLFSARAGSGIVISKLEDGSWSAPSAIGLGGFGFGGQLGAEVTDFLIVLNSRTAVRTFMAAGSMTLGGNLSVAVGPLGRNAEGSGSVSSKGKAAALYSYSKTKGLFGGVSVEGSIIVERQDANRLAYPDFGSNGPTSKELLSGAVPRPYWADGLAEVLDQCTGLPGGRKWVDDSMLDEDGRASPAGGRFGADDLDDGRGPNLGGGPRGMGMRSQSHAGRSPSMGSEYAFGAEGVGSFSSSSPGGRPKNNRSRSSSLASSVWKMDLMGNPTASPGGSNSPRTARSRASSLLGGGKGGLSSPGILGLGGRKRSGTSTPTQQPSFLEDDDGSRMQEKERNPFAAEHGSRLSEEGDFPRASMESNPFDAPDEKQRRREDKDLLGLDLSSVVISPWNNEKGLLTPPAKGYNSATKSFAVPFGDEDRPQNGRDRSASAATQTSRPGADRSLSNAQITQSRTVDLLDEWDVQQDKRDNQTRPRETTSGKRDDWDYSGQDNEPPFASYMQSESRSRSGSSPKPNISMRKELLEGKQDGLPRAIALYDFAADQDGDLGFKKGDVIVVTKGNKTDEWWTGRNSRTSSSGIFPANHVELANVDANLAAAHNRRVAPAFE